MKARGIVVAPLAAFAMAASCAPPPLPLPPESFEAAPGGGQATPVVPVAAVASTREPDSGADADAGADAGADAAPGFSFDTGRIVVAASENPHASADLFLVSLDGTLTPLTRTPDRDEANPRWSPDHTRIAFLATPRRTSWDALLTAELHVIDADGSNDRLLATEVDDSMWPPAWSPDGQRVLYLHPLPSCAPPPDPNWYFADPCVNDLRAVRLADGLDEDLALVHVNDKFALEPSWLRSGEVVYYTECRGEGCPGDGPWYAKLSPDATLASQWPYFKGAQERQRAYRRDPSRWAAVDVGWPYGEFSPAVGQREPASGSRGPIVVCSARAPDDVRYGGDCHRIVEDFTAWSPRWSPQEDRLAYLRADGIWVTQRDGSAPSRLLATVEAAGLDW